MGNKRVVPRDSRDDTALSCNACCLSEVEVEYSEGYEKEKNRGGSGACQHRGPPFRHYAQHAQHANTGIGCCARMPRAPWRWQCATRCPCRQRLFAAHGLRSSLMLPLWPPGASSTIERRATTGHASIAVEGMLSYRSAAQRKYTDIVFPHTAAVRELQPV